MSETERLYYDDSFLREFDAQVLSCEAAGDRWQVTLDRTAFYPSSGGQPYDTGKLGDANVVDVIDREADHAVLHITDRAVALGKIHGSIDWDRRFDHLQQHTGQHLLSATFIELFEMQTVSFHLGREISTIDLAASAITPAQLEAAERRTNEIIFADREIKILYGTAEELAAAGVRKQVERTGVLRAVEVEGFDRQPCGGTHASRTGQVGTILLRKCEKLKGNWRVEFVCGGRTVRAARSDATALNEVARLLSCGASEVPDMVARALEDRQATYRARQRLTEQLAQVQALMLLATDARSERGGVRTVCKVLEGQDANYARILASNMVLEPNVRALLATQEGNVIFAQSKGLDADMGGLLKECLALAGGKGGGAKDFAQGSVPKGADPAKVLDEAQKRLQR